MIHITFTYRNREGETVETDHYATDGQKLLQQKLRSLLMTCDNPFVRAEAEDVLRTGQPLQEHLKIWTSQPISIEPSSLS